MILDSYPKIQEAVLAIAYDNGLINREQSKERLLSECNLAILFAEVNQNDLSRIDRQLSELTPEQFETICIGDTVEAGILVSDHKLEDAHNLLDYLFEAM
jgi:hypothetical protein